MKTMKLSGISFLNKEDLKKVEGGKVVRSSCPTTGSCSGTCTDFMGNVGVCRTSSGPTYDCQCITGA
ncbi:hypothetical protein [Bacteroides sp. An51A]|uniref:hypothetical protein n=1 Tax=Bacteroides sp. An51A TaxID=1965640 RepID=UPI001177B59D|nr:hypothetical protein [Bacteroides sp. An51A]